MSELLLRFSTPAPVVVKQKRISTLKRVSGRLRRLLGNQDTPHEEAQMPRLLVVDDEESICFSMSEYFSYQGYKVDTARDFEEAERLIETTHYKVLTQDLRLSMDPNPDGLELIRLVHGRNPETKIIVFTAYGSAEMENEAIRCGADVFLRKPKPLSQVAQVVQDLIESPAKRARSSWFGVSPHASHRGNKGKGKFSNGVIDL